MHTSPILIVGKNAKTGWRVNRRLEEMGHATRAVSRSTTPVFDWEDQGTWHHALSGTRAAYITFQPDLAVPTAEQTLRDFVALAAELGLEHLVLLSGRGEDGARRAEIVVEESGLAWNIVRASWFMQNFSENFMIEGILGGELRLPAGNTVEPFIDVDDIAAVAVATLTRPELRNRVFEVSGPRSMTFAECTSAISKATGYPIGYTQIPLEDFIEELRSQGTPEALLWLMRELFSVVFDGRNSKPTTGVQEALGRPATDFDEYVRKITATGAWNRSGMQQRA
ncbi:MAG: NmrA family transcriptional regulator [Gammaproteobacteria bacterium]|nr:NmrA family transcriptional regulator [Gammaproteobacteria bacterium]